MLTHTAKKRLIVVVGPTAVGKTTLSIRIAQHFHTSIISADSRQCFRELTIGTAKPSAAELAAVKHYFINSHSIAEEVNAGIFERLASRYAAAIFLQHPAAVLCGGTGLYVKAFCDGIDQMPAISKEVRDAVRHEYKANGLSWLQEAVRQKDPGFFAAGETKNPQRLLRALEVVEATGRSILAFRKGIRPQHDFEIVRIGLDLPKEILRQRIHDRVDQMMAAGLVAEVESLLPYRRQNALQTVGYQEIFGYLGGAFSLAEAVEKIRINTRRYAKRQLTWFRKDPDIRWFDARDEAAVMEYLELESHR